MDSKELRKEFNRPSFRAYLYKELGESCINCGSNDGVEYHHIVPIANGGTNKIQNIVPLCHRCHMAVHGARKSWQDIPRVKKDYGRPQKISYEDALPILERYFHCEIGAKEAWDAMGFTGSVELSGTIPFKHYVEEHNITAYRNNIDIIRKKNDGVIPLGHTLGYVIIGNGEPEFFGNT